ncbi:unnamed protein product, partial [Tuber aestivum]
MCCHQYSSCGTAHWLESLLRPEIISDPPHFQFHPHGVLAIGSFSLSRSLSLSVNLSAPVADRPAPGEQSHRSAPQVLEQLVNGGSPMCKLRMIPYAQLDRWECSTDNSLSVMATEYRYGMVYYGTSQRPLFCVVRVRYQRRNRLGGEGSVIADDIPKARKEEGKEGDCE